MAILINDTTPRAQYTATAGQTAFSVPFEFFSNADLKVYKNSTLQTLTTHYMVSGAGVTGGGSITLTSGAAVGDIITVIRDIPVARTSDFPTSGPFNIDALNSDLDRLTAMVQERENAIERSLRMPDTDGTIATTLPAKAARQGRVLAFNATTGVPEAGPTITAIDNISTSSANVDTVAGSISNVNTVAEAISNVNATGSNIGNVNTVAGISSNVTSVAGNATNINTVASNSANVTTVASNISAVTTNATNITAIQNASTNATNAATSATAAASSASSAASSASSAASAASSAASAQSAAEAARDQTLTAFDNFDDRYLGTKSSDPTLDNDGNALAAGALYFNSASGVMKVYTGSAWVAAYVSGASTGALLATNNLSDLTSTGTARANLGLGTASLENTSAFAASVHTHGSTDISDSTTAGRALLTAADAAAQRTSLGLGTVATQAAPTGTLVGTTDTQTLTNKTLTTPVINGFTGSTALVNIGSGQFYKDTTGNIGIGTTSPGAPLDVKGAMRLSGSTSGYVGFTAAAAAGSTTYTLPSADGTSGQFLRTNGAGTLSWATPSAAVTSVVAGNGVTVSASTGDVTVSQDIYTGTAGNNTSYPIGTYLLVNLSSGASYTLTTSRTLYATNTASAAVIDSSGTGRTALTGTWRSRGVITPTDTVYNSGAGTNSTTNFYYGLFQRTA